jgi:hypothetical protein
MKFRYGCGADAGRLEPPDISRKSTAKQYPSSLNAATVLFLRCVCLFPHYMCGEFLESLPVGIEICCGVCSSTFVICRSCFRGQKYCSDQCKDSGYAKVRRRSRSKYEKSNLGRDRRRLYQTSNPGKEKHRMRQQAYRKRRHRRQVQSVHRLNLNPSSSFHDADHSLPVLGLVSTLLKFKTDLAALRLCPVCKRKIGRVTNGRRS